MVATVWRARRPGADGRSMAVFVPFVLPGEQVEAEIRQEKPGFARGSVTQLIEASPDRIDARCPISSNAADATTSTFPTSGSWSSKPQILRETLQRIAKIDLQV